jgi:hypothetical protein
VAIAVGDLITVSGKLLTMDEFDLANVGWWGQGTTLHGAVAAPPPYDDTQAGQLLVDSCPIRTGSGAPNGPTGEGDPPPSPPK